jgi:hypothetical protein
MAEFSYQLVEDVAKELYIRALKYLPPGREGGLAEGL